jgi:hypothetical protein
MAVSQRIRGQEVSLAIVRDGQLETELVDIQNFNYSVQSETKVQGYLGEPGNRTDDIFNNVKFDMEMNIHSQDWGPFIRAVVDRQQRRTPDVQFNISAILNYANGQTQSINIQDAKFGEFPMNVPARGDYIKIKLDGVADEVKIVEL